MTMRTLGAFVGIAFGLSWGLMSLHFAFPDQLERIFGPVGYTNPLFVTAVYAPALAGLALVGKHYGLRGLGSFLRRLMMWRAPPDLAGRAAVGLDNLRGVAIGPPFPDSTAR